MGSPLSTKGLLQADDGESSCINVEYSSYAKLKLYKLYICLWVNYLRGLDLEITYVGLLVNNDIQTVT